jgi:hypothetical protein
LRCADAPIYAGVYVIAAPRPIAGFSGKNEGATDRTRKRLGQTLMTVAAPTQPCRNDPELSAIALHRSPGGSPLTRNSIMTVKHQHRSGDSTSNANRAAQAVGVGALLACAVAVPAAEPTVSVIETVQVASTAGRTWDAIKDFSSWQSWHPAFASTRMLQGDGRSKGAVRMLVTKDGGRFTEELVAFDPGARSYQYRIIDSPAPVKDYVSTIQVKETPTGSTVVWSSHFSVTPGTSEADARKLISGVYRAGLDNLAAVME